jgi:D-amino-acid dehydrogenase
MDRPAERSEQRGVAGRAVVVGGGVIGAACAYYLARDGWHVTVLEQNAFGGGCSHGNCGLVCPSNVLPLAAPGAVSTALRSLFRPASPFHIKPRLDPSLWMWLLGFARRCNARDMLQAAEGIHALLAASRTLYDELFRTEPFECEWETRGLCLVFQTPASMAHHAEMAHLLEDRFGVTIQRYDGEALIELEPALKPGLAGGWLYPNDAHLRPDRLMSGWRAVLEARGVEIREQCGVLGLKRESGRVRAARTLCGDVDGDVFVVATGAWTPLLNRELGCRVPIQPGKGYSITMPRPARCPRIPLLLEEHGVAVTPMQSGYRLGSTMEFAGYDATVNRRRLEALRAGARHYLHEPEAAPIQEEWFGWRPMTYDSLPIIDRSPRAENLWVAAGHNMLGVSMSPATGKLLAELVGGRPSSIDPRPYSLQRFQV